MPYIIAILVVVALGVGFTVFQSNKTEPVATTEISGVTDLAPNKNSEPVKGPSSSAPEVAAPASDYKDGEYSTQTTYLTPRRDEYGVAVSLSLSKDIVTGVTVTYSQGAENDPNAARFEAAYKAQVIGKDIDTLNLSRVGGASLTTGAFNKALITIKADAKS